MFILIEILIICSLYFIEFLRFLYIFIMSH